MKVNDHPNPADVINRKIEGYIFEKEDDTLIFVLDKFLIRVPFSTLIIKSREEAI